MFLDLRLAIRGLSAEDVNVAGLGPHESATEYLIRIVERQAFGVEVRRVMNVQLAPVRVDILGRRRLRRLAAGQ